ncbi:MAG: hypothetical protein CL801_12920 [Citromicrobium sp.]|nr:hypothetical protein [Citromicrobium sp.]
MRPDCGMFAWALSAAAGSAIAAVRAAALIGFARREGLISNLLFMMVLIAHLTLLEHERSAKARALLRRLACVGRAAIISLRAKVIPP